MSEISLSSHQKTCLKNLELAHKSVKELGGVAGRTIYSLFKKGFVFQGRRGPREKTYALTPNGVLAKLALLKELPDD